MSLSISSYLFLLLVTAVGVEKISSTIVTDIGFQVCKEIGLTPGTLPNHTSPVMAYNSVNNQIFSAWISYNESSNLFVILGLLIDANNLTMIIDNFQIISASAPITNLSLGYNSINNTYMIVFTYNSAQGNYIVSLGVFANMSSINGDQVNVLEGGISSIRVNGATSAFDPSRISFLVAFIFFENTTGINSVGLQLVNSSFVNSQSANSVSIQNGTISNLDISYDSVHDVYLVVFQQNAKNISQGGIFSFLVSPVNGTRISEIYSVSNINASTNTSFHHPQVTFNSKSAEFYVIFEIDWGNSKLGSSIGGRSVSGSTGIPSLSYNILGGNSSATPSIAYSTLTNEYEIVFGVPYSNLTSDLNMLTFNSSSNLTMMFSLNNSNHAEYNPQIVYVPSSNRFVMIWESSSEIRIAQLCPTNISINISTSSTTTGLSTSTTSSSTSTTSSSTTTAASSTTTAASSTTTASSSTMIASSSSTSGIIFTTTSSTGSNVHKSNYFAMTIPLVVVLWYPIMIS